MQGSIANLGAQIVLITLAWKKKCGKVEYFLESQICEEINYGSEGPNKLLAWLYLEATPPLQSHVASICWCLANICFEGRIAN